MLQNNILFWFLICGHLIGDFYFQSKILVNKKNKKIRYIFMHGLIYGLTMFIVLLPIMNIEVLGVFLIVTISHLIIDIIKIAVIKHTKVANFFRKYIFHIDQFIHIAIILIIAYVNAIINTIALNSLGKNVLEIYSNLQINHEPIQILRIFFALLLIGKPTNIFIKEINQKGKIKNTEDKVSGKNPNQDCSQYENAGSIIGTLERILIIVMVILGQYAAIGIVFAAKSITRYDKISKEPSFAEYYLVGTLLSLLVAILSVLLIQPI